MVNDIRRPQPQSAGRVVQTTMRNQPVPVETINMAAHHPVKEAPAHAIGGRGEEELTPPSEQSDKPNKSPSKRPVKPHKKPPKWLLFSLIGLGVALIAGCLFLLLRPEQKAPTSEPIAKSETPSPIFYNPLSGLQGSEANSKLPVIGVMIENSPDARPQSGLSQAGVVYEAIAEGGITRFLALFQDESKINLGPVRSARPYYVQWLAGYDASYAHVGGSSEALSDIKAWKIKDMDQFANASAYHRTSDRLAPHNMYTSLDKLLNLSRSKGYTTSDFTGFERKDDSPLENPTAKQIKLAISSANYNVSYAYDSATDSYKRSEGGSAHIDANTKEQLAPKNVVALITSYSIAADGVHSSYKTIGNGQAYVFLDGQVISAKWQKDSLEAPLKLTTKDNQPIKLNRGQTWITAISRNSQLEYTP